MIQADIIQRAVDVIREQITMELKFLIAPKLRGSGYLETHSLNHPPSNKLFISLCHFGSDDEGETISYDENGWGLTVQGYTATGVIEGFYGGGLAIVLYEDLSTEQLLFAYKLAFDHLRDLQ